MKVIPTWKKTADWLIAVGMVVLFSAGSYSFSFARSAATRPQAGSGAENTTSEEKITQELHARHYDQAEAQARNLTALQPENENAWLLLGVAEMQLKQVGLARESFEQVLKLNPNDPRAFFNLGLLYSSLGKVKEAIESYQKGLRLDNHNSVAYFNYGRLLMNQKKFAEAAQALARACELNPNDVVARTSWIECLAESGKAQEAVTKLPPILKSHDVALPILLKLGRLFVTVRKAPAARDVLTRAISLAPYNAEAYVVLSRAYILLQQPEDATRAAGRAAQLAPDSLDANVAVAEALIAWKHYSVALKFLNNIEPRFNQFAAYHYEMGIVQLGMQQPSGALKEFKTAIQIDPKMDVAYGFLGTLYSMSGKLLAAEQAYRKAIQLNSKNPSYYSYLAKLYESMGPQYEKQELENLKKALALDPHDLESEVRMARWLVEHGEYKQARTLLEDAVKRHPEMTSAHVQLAQVYFKLHLQALGKRELKIVQTLTAQSQKEKSQVQ